MDIKELKKKSYHWSAANYTLYKRILACLLLVLLVTIVFVEILTSQSVLWRSFWLEKNPVIHWLVLGLVVFLGLMVMGWLLFFKWYSIWFRYLAYFGAWVYSLLRRMWSIWWIKFLCLLIAVHLVQWGRYALVYNNKGRFNLIDFLRSAFIVKTLGILALFLIFYGIYKARKQVSVSDFKNYTGIEDKELDGAVKGMGSRILKEMNRVTKLVQTIDEIQPDKPKNNFELLGPKVDILDYGKNLTEIVGSQTDITIGPFFKIPLAPLINFLSRLLHGPNLDGGLYSSGEKLILDVQLKGGKFNGAWSVNSDELEPDIPSSKNEKVIKMIEVLVFKIFAYLGGSGSPRWQAVKYYTEGLNHYRESARTNANETINLIKAKKAFGLSLRDDGEFFQCYYNLGVVYMRLDSLDAAETAFRNVLGLESCNYYGYYQLAYIYYTQKNYAHAQWFCEEALMICPSKACHWNLLANIKFRRWVEENHINQDYTTKFDLPEDVLDDFMNASMLAWRVLCKGIIKGEKLTDHKNKAMIFIRNLAKMRGIQIDPESRSLFKQALFLEPDNNDLLFELGKSFYRRGKIKKAYDAFKQVFEDNNEIEEPCTFWAFYLSVNAKQYNSTKKKKKVLRKMYKEGVEQSYLHFLECVSKEINNPDDPLEEDDADFEQNFERSKTLIIDDLNHMGMKSEAKQIEFIPKLRNMEKRFKDVTNRMLRYCFNCDDKSIGNCWFKKFLQILEDKTKTNSKWWWTRAQTRLFFARKILKEANTEKLWKIVIPFLTKTIKILAQENPNEIKLLGLNRYLAEAYFRLKEYERAIHFARIAIRLDPYDFNVRRLLGEIFFDLKDYSTGLDELVIGFNCGLQLDLDILNKMGDAYQEKLKIVSDAKQKEEVLKKAIDLFSMALTKIEDKSYKETEGEYLPLLISIHHYLGVFYAEMKDSDKSDLHSQIARGMGY